jgi:hypothetical protein
MDKTVKVIVAACIAVLGAGLMPTTPVKAAASNGMTRITFSGPVALPGMTLGAGTYVFELADPDTGRRVVLVRNKERRVFYVGMTNRVERPAGLRAHQPVLLGESPRGVPPPIKSWYPEGDNVGHEFIYPAGR